MALQVLINLLVAFLWMFLQDEWSMLSFFSGYLVGILIVFVLRRFFPSSFYLKKCFAAVYLFWVFFRESIVSSIYVIGHVIRPRLKITPGIFRLETELESDLEVTLLALLITLTPGSVVMKVTPDKKAFYVHALNLPDSVIAVISSKNKFEHAIRKVTR
ncbi:Na+/H+ antiporter subunit E [Neobacillus kokaensis]|uniref:Na+/H+ antiporter subunit E n=1 Tax=Neobacillus kokaensis TaxID=2759023 RepID=A0ABQ3N9Z2_9BACI|nr:Na+/H+ antiporter subunit E [Neobacillus kokaensis]GHI00793.1 Na+/H+ antiporter subunit E [Neobacillus kokaensis]